MENSGRRSSHDEGNPVFQIRFAIPSSHSWNFSLVLFSVPSPFSFLSCIFSSLIKISIRPWPTFRSRVIASIPDDRGPMTDLVPSVAFYLLGGGKEGGREGEQVDGHEY